MDNDLSTRGGGIKRIEQKVRNDLNNFTPESQNPPIRLKALINDNSLPLGLGTIEIRYFAKHGTHVEFCELVAVAMKLEHVSGNAC